MFVYRIDTKLTKSQALFLYENLSMEEISDFQKYDMKAFDVETKGKISSYVITNRYVLTRIILFLRSRNIDFSYENITNKVFFNEVNFEDVYFTKEIEDFIKENITLDDILDKINCLGIDSLTEIDKKILVMFSE
jgi:hypothetical protein